jgi:hypothetical protein
MIIPRRCETSSRVSSRRVPGTVGEDTTVKARESIFLILPAVSNNLKITSGRVRS